MTKVIPFSQLTRRQHLHFLEHQRREYREREDYLNRLRKLLFQIEGQMRQAEILQLELLRQVADHFLIPLKFPSPGDRWAMQQFFAEDPLLFLLTEYFADRLSPAECYRKILELQENQEKE